MLNHLCLCSISINSDFLNLFTLFTCPNSVIWVSVGSVLFLISSKVFICSIIIFFVLNLSPFHQFLCFIILTLNLQFIKFMFLLSHFTCEAVVKISFFGGGEEPLSFAHCFPLFIINNLLPCVYIHFLSSWLGGSVHTFFMLL